VAAVVVLPKPCLACSCVAASDEDKFEQADVVFTGTVTEGESADFRSDIVGAEPMLFTFDVDAVQKGGAAPEQGVLTNKDEASCGVPFEDGKLYQVFAHRNDDGQLETTGCQGTRELRAGSGEDAQPYIPLGPDGKPRRGTYISAEGTPPPRAGEGEGPAPAGLDGTFVAGGEGLPDAPASATGSSDATLPILAMGAPLLVVGLLSYARARRTQS
jgi:hypothetical protein